MKYGGSALLCIRAGGRMGISPPDFFVIPLPLFLPDYRKESVSMPERKPESKQGKVKASSNRTWKRGYRSKGPSKSMKIRANGFLLGGILTAATALSVNLFRIMIVQHDEYTERASSRQFSTITLAANRGTIFDANGTVLAQSATVYRIFVDPGLFAKEMELIEENNQKQIESAEQSEDPDAVPDLVDTGEVKRQLASFLADTLELEYGDVLDAFDKKDSNYIVLKKQVEKTKADKILDYVSEMKVPGSERKISLASVSRESDTKRYYPQNELAAAVIGFTGSDGNGLYGVEAYYDEYLSGIDGKTITATDASGNEMPYRYSKTYAAQDGDDVYLTIDMTLQTYLENAVSDMVDTYEVANRACGIILNAKTGAVMAMASVGGFDPNEPYEIADADVLDAINAITDEDERSTALGAARETQWRNKAVTETYTPGSVFKVYTASSALEENKISYSDSFYCPGTVDVAGIPYHCWKISGHGSETFEEILINSCNPAFISVGQKLGRTLFAQYFRAYGLAEKTGIDLPGETNSIHVDLENMSEVDLASSSFGQANALSPIQMVTGYAAVVNGGQLLQPYVVSKVVDQAGNVVLQNEKTVRRQVISEETSAEMRKALQAVVDNNGGSNASIAGYKIGGKSGTAQKLQGYISAELAEYIASYCCFAPADDPEIVLLILADEPNKSIDYYGSSVVAPYSRSVLEKALPYLGYYPSYDEDDESAKRVTVPLLIDNSVTQVIETLDELGLSYETIGDGQYVSMQTPLTGSEVTVGSTVLLYTGGITQTETVEVPDVVGLSMAEANAKFAEGGLNFIAKGASASRDDVQVLLQSIPGGTTVEKWSVITVDLGSMDETG